MRILLVHNYYRTRGGEGVVFEQEARLLESLGHDVVRLWADNAESSWIGLVGSLGGLGTRRRREEVEQSLGTRSVDLIHAHNLFPLFTPWLYRTAARLRIPVVQTLHNYRMICAAETLYRADGPCTRCLDRSRVQGLRHRCFRGSLVATLGVTATSERQRRAALSRAGVAAFVALTDFARGLFERAGFPADRLHVNGNFTEDPGFSSSLSEPTILFVGRLVPEKGLHTLMAGWSAELPGRLEIIGEGPLQGEVRAWASSVENASSPGRIARPDVVERMRHARALVFPSEWYEGFPMVVVEAMAAGLPVVTPALGGVAEIAPPGEVSLPYGAGRPGELRQALARILSDREFAARLGRAARTRFEERHTAARSGRALDRIYGIARSRASRKGRP